MKYLTWAIMLPLVIASTSCVHQQMREDIVDEMYIHRYGIEVPCDYWTSSGQDGVVVSTLANGIVVSKTFSAGVLDGEVTQTFPHSQQIQKKQLYQKGHLIKDMEYFYEGTPMSETTFGPAGSTKEITFWYTNGNRKSYEKHVQDRLMTGEYYNISEQQDASVDNFEGIRIHRDEYGQMISQDTIHEGKCTLCMIPHPNGSPKALIPYKDGLVEGTKKTFYPGGEPNTVEEWVRGYQQGMTTIYLNGEKSHEIPYVAGRKNGIEKQYREDGRILREISWENDVLHGPSVSYLGESQKTEWYFAGALTTRANYEAQSSHSSLK